MTTSDTPPGSPSTPPARPVTSVEISAFLHHLTQLRSPAHTYDQADHAERAAVLAHKAELFDRIADQHTGADQAHARQIAQHARAAAAEETARLHPNITSTDTVMINTPTAQPGRLTNHTTRRR